MRTQPSCTFLLGGESYEMIAMAGSEILPTPHQFYTPLEGPRTPPRHATFEIVMDRLYLIGLTFEKENIRYLSVGAAKSLRNTYAGPSVFMPYTGKIRLARNRLYEPYISTSYQKALAFESVLDLSLREGEIFEVKDRSPEMTRKRSALREYYQSVIKLRNLGSCAGTGSGVTKSDRKVISIEDRAQGTGQVRNAVREHRVFLGRLEKALYAYDLDVDLE